jgi:DNA segregation ATPase FtsK/SpoIIIE, S-DNA-T family
MGIEDNYKNGTISPPPMPPSIDKTRTRTPSGRSGAKRSAVPRRGLEDEAPAWLLPWFAELLWVVWAVVALLVGLSLISFSPNDHGWFQISSELTPQNWLGRFGAALADGLLFFFGLSAGWLVILSLMLSTEAWRFAARARRAQSLGDPPGSLGPATGSPLISGPRLGGFILMWSSSAALEAQRLSIPEGFFSHLPGGALGSFLGSSLEWLVGGTGLTLLALIGFFVGFGLFMRLSWIGLFESIGRAVEHSTQAIERRWQARQDRRLGLSTAEERAERVEIKRRVRPESEVDLMPVSQIEPASLSPQEALRGKQDDLFAADPIAGSHPMPDLSLLEAVTGRAEPVSADTLQFTSRLIENRLVDFGISVRVVSAQPGPVITRYEIEPASGVKGSQIVNLARDLARALSLTSVRVVETIPGKNLMGLELPNPRRQTVRLSEIIGSRAFQESGASLPLALGKDISGGPAVVDLAKMPHLLVAGTTGSGKSVGVNAMLLSLLYHAPADRIRLILIDPKMLELSIYEGIPHLLTPVVTDMKLAANALHWCVGEMERRYRLMSKMNTRGLSSFNQRVEEALRKGRPILDPLATEEMVAAGEAKALQPLPQIVVVIDELADLMMVVGKKIEELIARLAQKARAAGIHLILATQRPSVDVITGLIKANIPSRISFQVSSKIDSRTILDQMGAEALLGQGDMLFLAPGAGVPIRIHGAFVADEEVLAVVQRLRETGGARYDDQILEGADPESGGAFTVGLDVGSSSQDAESDALYDDAVAVVLQHRRASISLVQRHLRIGYNRAARLLEAMEKAGLVSSMQSNGNRDILVPAARE